MRLARIWLGHTAGHALPMGPARYGSPIDEFIEAAFLTILRLFLMEKCQLVLVEDPEEFVPGDFLQVFLRLSEIDPQKAASASGVLHAGRVSASCFHPLTN